MSELLKIDNEYAKWIEDLSVKFKKAQIKASVSVNAEMLRFYYIVGEGVFKLTNKNTYGNNLIENISKDLREKLPSLRGISITNIRYMKRFYETFRDMEIRPQLGGESSSELIYPQLFVNPDESLVFMIPWGHMKVILDKCKCDKEKGLFYVKETIENNWSRAVLLNFIDTNLYERKGKAINNFDKNLPDINSDLAKEITRDPYNFDFLSIREKYDEKELKDALMDNIQKFLLELGNRFSFVGREYRLKVGETEQFLDMLFYNIKLRCYVVVEVKVRDFKPEDMGQLSTYVSCVNHILKSDGDNQTIGILICKNKDNILAKYAIETQNEPVAISEYELSKLFPKDFKTTMPTIDEIERELMK